VLAVQLLFERLAVPKARRWGGLLTLAVLAQAAAGARLVEACGVAPRQRDVGGPGGAPRGQRLGLVLGLVTVWLGGGWRLGLHGIGV
jgi:hypothetical protein